jgi:hypothetical protein
MPAESSNYYLRGMNLKCRHCGYSGLPLAAGVCIYDKLKVNRPEDPGDRFGKDLAPGRIFPRMALLSLFTSVVSVMSVDLRLLTSVSFAGFVLFAAFSVFFRFREGA